MDVHDKSVHLPACVISAHFSFSNLSHSLFLPQGISILTVYYF